MELTLEQLIAAQKGIESLFRRPVIGRAAPLDPTLLKLFVSTEAYRWGLRNLAGVAVSWPRPAELQLHLAGKPIPGFQVPLQKLFPGIALHFLVTGRFLFLANSGADIFLDTAPEIGTIALFLKDGLGSSYALTCAHVLEDDPTQKPQVDTVDHGGAQRIGVLTQRVALRYGCSPVVEPNQVDCALTQLDGGVARSNALSPPPGGNIVGIGSAQQNDPVAITNDSTEANGIVSSTLANACVYDAQSDTCAYFENLLSVTGAAGIGPGDSGTVVLSSQNYAVGMVMAVSVSGLVLACDMQKVIDALQLVVGRNLTLA